MRKNTEYRGICSARLACLSGAHDVCLNESTAARLHAAGDYGGAVHARLSGAAHRGQGLSAAETVAEGLFALAGLSGVTLYFLMENIALTYISASLVGVIVAAGAAVYRADRSGRAARKTQQMVLFRLCLCDGGCRARVARGRQ